MKLTGTQAPPTALIESTTKVAIPFAAAALGAIAAINMPNAEQAAAALRLTASNPPRW